MKNACLPLLVVIVFLAGCSGGELTEDRARSTVDTLLAKGSELPDNCCPPATLVEWRGLVAISDTEMQAKAVIQHSDGKMTGAFVFHKTASGEWVADHVTFHSGTGWSSSFWNQDVFQKVE